MQGVSGHAYLYRFENLTNSLHPHLITINTYAEDLVIGLSNTMKRRETFRWLKLKNYAIYFLQEVHCTKEKEILWTSEWGFSAVFSSYSSASAGTCILFNNNFEFCSTGAYLSELITLKTVSRYSLRSSGEVLLQPPRIKTLRTLGDRSFTVAAPALWDNLPNAVRCAQSVQSFRDRLKTHLFRQAFDLY